MRVIEDFAVSLLLKRCIFNVLVSFLTNVGAAKGEADAGACLGRGGTAAACADLCCGSVALGAPSA